MSAEDMTRVAIACQGGGSHTAFTAGVLRAVLRERPERYEIGALSGTSGGAICALLAWDGLRRERETEAYEDLARFWEAIAAHGVWDRLANDWALSVNRLFSELGTFGVSPYYNPVSDKAQDHLRETVERFVDLPATEVGPDDPDLFVGAADVQEGEFTVFKNGEGGVDAVLASAAVPTLFPAVTVDGRQYWDGLFSQNPPIRHFTTEVDADEKPDEIWIVRINPTRTWQVPTSMGEILDRRNELAGNLSLEQEIDTIEAINDLIDDDVITDDRYKHIDVVEVELDRPLDVHTKLDRDPAFIADLVARGERRAHDLWETG